MLEEKPQSPAKLNISPAFSPPAKESILAGSKGLLIGILVVLIAIVIGISALIGFKSADQYEGLIRKIENQTEQLKQEGQNSPENTLPGVPSLP